MYILNMAKISNGGCISKGFIILIGLNPIEMSSFIVYCELLKYVT